MHEIVLQPLIDELVVASPASEIYVIDVDFRVLLRGTSPADLVPAARDGRDLPTDLDDAVRRIVTRHDFATAAVARTSTGKKSLRVLRLTGPAGQFYGVLARPRRRIARTKAV